MNCILEVEALDSVVPELALVDELVLVSEKEGILALSLWKTREDAERYNRTHYGEVHKLIQHLIHAEMKVHTYDIETSTVHHIAKGVAA